MRISSKISIIDPKIVSLFTIAKTISILIALDNFSREPLVFLKYIRLSHAYSRGLCYK